MQNKTAITKNSCALICSVYAEVFCNRRLVWIKL